MNLTFKQGEDLPWRLTTKRMLVAAFTSEADARLFLDAIEASRRSHEQRLLVQRHP